MGDMIQYLLSKEDFDCLKLTARELRVDINYKRYGMIKYRSTKLQTIIMNAVLVDDEKLRENKNG
jgi:hypothetical protein